MDNFLSFLSLSKKAGKAVCGASGAYQSTRSYKARLLIVACDASDNTKKDAYNMAKAKDIKLLEIYTKNELGHATGKDETAMIAITDSEFAKQLLKLSAHN
ncbi:hypothetical protein SDC9_198326 [bioreactor metagenome]|uniref:Ribosomal protein eL8/eL30/eS12/Gadd45 domain-containing protein n=1 Tax=bioreactor metagenome TaxID=1076179 RepID=A0A645IQR4_9ZZZZ